ncbi:hypothetical protein PILCRDRAFT_827074, partial [Piloderma croceum F 1598]
LYSAESDSSQVHTSFLPVPSLSMIATMENPIPVQHRLLLPYTTEVHVVLVHHLHPQPSQPSREPGRRPQIKKLGPARNGGDHASRQHGTGQTIDQVRSTDIRIDLEHLVIPLPQLWLRQPTSSHWSMLMSMLMSTPKQMSTTPVWNS